MKKVITGIVALALVACVVFIAPAHQDAEVVPPGMGPTTSIQ